MTVGITWLGIHDHHNNGLQLPLSVCLYSSYLILFKTRLDLGDFAFFAKNLIYCLILVIRFFLILLPFTVKFELSIELVF